MILGILSGSTILYNIQYMIMEPAYKCLNDDLITYRKCTKEEICTNSTLKWEVDFSKVESLNNWTQQLDLYCTPSYQLGLFGSMFFFGAFIGSFILPRLADLVGRRPIYLFGLVLYALSAILHPLSSSLYFTYALIFLGGISESGRYYVGFVYL